MVVPRLPSVEKMLQAATAKAQASARSAAMAAVRLLGLRLLGLRALWPSSTGLLAPGSCALGSWVSGPCAPGRRAPCAGSLRLGAFPSLLPWPTLMRSPRALRRRSSLRAPSICSRYGRHFWLVWGARQTVLARGRASWRGRGLRAATSASDLSPSPPAVACIGLDVPSLLLSLWWEGEHTGRV